MNFSVIEDLYSIPFLPVLFRKSVISDIVKSPEHSSCNMSSPSKSFVVSVNVVNSALLPYGVLPSI